MRYRNAAHILPDELLRELQKYAEGEAVYIPKRKEKVKWGESSGARRFYEERNEKLRLNFQNGQSIEELAELYGLSVERIRRIVYSGK